MNFACVFVVFWRSSEPFGVRWRLRGASWQVSLHKVAPDLLASELLSRFGGKMVPTEGPFCTYVQCLGILFELLFLDLFLKDFVDGFWCPRVQFSRFSGVADMAKVL